MPARPSERWQPEAPTPARNVQPQRSNRSSISIVIQRSSPHLLCFGAQIGAEAKDWVIAFMTDEALKKFRESKGWEAGVDGNVALITVGGGGSGTTRNAEGDIIGFVFDVKGLMADVSFKGAKFTKLDMSK